jgi:hypothetical protein
MSQRFQLPSLITLAIILLTFLFFSTFQSFLGEGSAPFRREFQDHFSAKEKGTEFLGHLRVAKSLKNRESIYSGGEKRYGSPPQALLILIPFTQLSESAAYRLYIVLIFVGLWGLFTLLGLVNTGHCLYYVLFFPAATLLSYPGLMVFERGNLEGLGAVFVALAVVCLQRRNVTWVALSVAIASCLSPLYAPLSLVLAVLPPRRTGILIWLGIHLVALVWVSTINGNVWLGLDYLTGLPIWREATDINVWISPVVLVLLCAGALFVYGLGQVKYPSGQDLPLSLFFGFLLYVTVLGSCRSAMNDLIALLLLVPITDRIYRNSSSSTVRSLTILHAVLLGLTFIPPELQGMMVQALRSIWFGLDLVTMGALVYLNRAIPASPYQERGQLPVQALVLEPVFRMGR